ARILTHVEPHAHPAAVVRREWRGGRVSRDQAGPDALVQRGTNDDVRRPAAATREVADVRFHARGASRASNESLLGVAGQLTLLGGGGEPGGVQLDALRARRL